MEANVDRTKTGLLGALLRYGVPLVITVGLCWLLFSNEEIDPAEMWRIVREDCDFRWIALNLSLGILAQIFRAARWQIQLRALDIRPSFGQLVLSIFGTYSVNLVFPRLGEVWRTGYIAARQRAQFTTVFGSMVADRLADTLTVLILLLLTFIPAGAQLRDYLGQSGGALAKLGQLLGSPLLWGGFVVAVAVIWIVFVKYPEHRFVAAIRRIASGLWEGFVVVAKMPGRGRWLLYTVLIWGSYVMALYCAFRSFPLTAEVLKVHGLTALAVCFVLTSLSMGVPSNGGIGPWQWAMIFGLTLYSSGVAGLTREYSLTFANLVMGVQTLMFIVQGLLTFSVIAFSKNSKKQTVNNEIR